MVFRLPRLKAYFSRPVVLLPDKENPQGERRFRAIGSTSKGRHAFVVFTLRNHGKGVLLRPISARYMHKKEVRTMRKTIPTFKTDKQAEDFVATADLSKYDLSGGQVMRFELKPKNASVTFVCPNNC